MPQVPGHQETVGPPVRSYLAPALSEARAVRRASIASPVFQSKNGGRWSDRNECARSDRGRGSYQSTVTGALKIHPGSGVLNEVIRGVQLASGEQNLTRGQSG